LFSIESGVFCEQVVTGCALRVASYDPAELFALPTTGTSMLNANLWKLNLAFARIRIRLAVNPLNPQRATRNP